MVCSTGNLSITSNGAKVKCVLTLILYHFILVQFKCSIVLSVFKCSIVLALRVICFPLVSISVGIIFINDYQYVNN